MAPREKSRWPLLALLAAAACGTGSLFAVPPSTRGSSDLQPRLGGTRAAASLGALDRLALPRDVHVEARGGEAIRWSEGPRSNPVKQERKQELWLKYSQNMNGRQRDEFRLSVRAVQKKLKQIKKARKLKNREFRRMAVMRVGANAKLHGLRYSELIHKLKEANININRKIMSQLGIYDRAVLTNIIEAAVPDWKETKQLREEAKVPKTYTVEEIDDIMVPYLEKYQPDLYTNPNVRFNRKVTDQTVEYTVDIGDPQEWRDMLARSPELANFNIPDHWIPDGNAEKELVPLELYKEGSPWVEKKLKPIYEEALKEQQVREQMEGRGEKVEAQKEGVGRDDWFKKEEQSWM